MLKPSSPERRWSSLAACGDGLSPSPCWGRLSKTHSECESPRKTLTMMYTLRLIVSLVVSSSSYPQVDGDSSKSLEATGEHSTTLCPRAFRKIKEQRHQVKLEHETRLTSNELWSIMLMHVKRKAKRPAKEWRLSCTKCGHEWTVEVKALTWRDYPEPQLCPLCQGKSIRMRGQRFGERNTL